MTCRFWQFPGIRIISEWSQWKRGSILYGTRLANVKGRIKVGPFECFYQYWKKSQDVKEPLGCEHPTSSDWKRSVQSAVPLILLAYYTEADPPNQPRRLRMVVVELDCQPTNDWQGFSGRVLAHWPRNHLLSVSPVPLPVWPRDIGICFHPDGWSESK